MSFKTNCSPINNTATTIHCCIHVFYTELLQQKVIIVATSSQNGFVSTKFLDNGSKMTLSIDPFAIGNNNFKIVFTDLAGDPIGIKSTDEI